MERARTVAAQELLFVRYALPWGAGGRLLLQVRRLAEADERIESEKEVNK